MAQVWCVSRTSFHPILMRSWCGCLDTLYDSPFYSLLSIFSLIVLSILLFFTFFFHVEDKYPAHSREWGPWHPCRERSSHRLWANDLHISETSDIFIQESSGDNNMILNSMTTPSAWRSVHHCSPRSEKMQRAVDKLVTLLTKVCRPVSRRLSVMSEQHHLLLIVWFTNPKRQRKSVSRLRKWANQDSSGTTERADSRWFLSRDSKTRIPGRLWQKLNEVIESQRGEIYRAHQGDEQLRRDQQLIHEQLLEQNRDLREAHEKSLNEMEELKRFQESTFDTMSRRRWIEYRDTFLELASKIQELQNEINCKNDSRDFQGAESVRSGQSHVTSQPVFFAPVRDPGGMLSRSLGMPSRNNGPPSIGDTHGISGNVFANPTASSSAPSPQESNPSISNVSEHTSPHVMSESQTPNTSLDPRCQSGPSARNSFDPGEGRFSKHYGADQQRLQISDPHFDKFPTPATFACWKIRFKTEVCTCSQFPTEAMLWTKEVELVDLVDDLKSSCSVRGTQGPDFEVLDAKIASALNRIIRNTRFKKKISLEEQKDSKRRSLSPRKTDRLPDLRILPGHWSQWFCRESCRPIYMCSSKWWYSGIRFKMGRNFIINDEHLIWWHLGVFVQIQNTRVWETQDRIGIVWPGDSPEEVRTWLSQIESYGEEKYRARFTKQELLGPEMQILKGTPWSRNREQNIVNKELKEIVGIGKPTGSVLKETIAVSVTISISVLNRYSRTRLLILSCSRMKRKRREPEVLEERVPVVESLDGPARITSKELAPIHSVQNGILQNACSTSRRMDADLGKSALMSIARLMNSLAKGLKKEWWQKCSGYVEEEWASPKNTATCFACLLIKYTTIGLRVSRYGAAEVSIDFTEELRHTETDPTCKIHQSCCTSRWHSRPKSFARNDLPRWTSSA